MDLSLFHDTKLIFHIFFACATIGYVTCDRPDLNVIINNPVNCSHSQEVLEECSVAQGYSFLLNEFAWPKNQTALTEACKRNTAGIKCLRSYSKCLTKVQKSVASALLGTRSKFVKQVCSDKQNADTKALIEASKCIYKHKLNTCKMAERKAIALAEAIAKNSESFKKLTGDIQIRHACCTMALVKKGFIDALKPECSQHAPIIASFIDSNLGDASGSLCPDLDAPRTLLECSELPPFPESNPKSKFYMMPILQVINLFQ